MKIITVKSPGFQYPAYRSFEESTDILNKYFEKFKKIKSFYNNDLKFICTGSSGMFTATYFATRCQDSGLYDEIEVEYLNKPKEDCHGRLRPYVNNKGVKNIIIDDFISSGFTVNRLYQEIFDKDGAEVDCLIVGAYLRYKQKVHFEPKYVITNSNE